MRWKPVSSRYRYCISRLSRMATSTGSSALKVLSSTRPVRTFLSLVRTNAPPLPGLTCWNSMTFIKLPSMLSVMPVLRSFVVVIGRALLGLLADVGGRVDRAWTGGSQDQQVLGGLGEQLVA